MRNENFSERMKRVPDEELFTVIHSEGFVPAAVEAAKAELERRNLKEDEFARIETQFVEQRLTDDDKPTIPLGGPGKAAFFIFGILFFWSLLAALILRFMGYRRKSNDAFVWMAGGIVFWIAVGTGLQALA